MEPPNPTAVMPPRDEPFIRFRSISHSPTALRGALQETHEAQKGRPGSHRFGSFVLQMEGYVTVDILVGPYDWKDYDLGKDGVERYRLHNLPLALSGPGTYELGIDLTATNESGRVSRTINLADVISVYIGHTGNLRKRLQEYGRRGSHLENGKSDPYSEERRQGLFQGVFSRGFPILFRYHMTHDKNKASDLESKILKRFDYAWNNAGNGHVRQLDILSRLDEIHSIEKHQSILTDLRKWLSPRIKKYVGAKITTSSPSNEDVYPDCKIIPRVFKTSKNCPSLVQPKGYSNDTMCGFRTVDGSVCGSRPDIEREENESMPVNRNSESDSVFCGWVGADGYVCKNEPISRRKRCEVHKGRRITNNECAPPYSVTKVALARSFGEDQLKLPHLNTL
ncbi:hypothetical protein QJS04_geneDACA022824 [Acorus gramineus]|uniref:GIY-YIG domain-containing protein n=1 Tax=Acorus gramineus TaxID=55184 RepID=A0AAV9BQI6_ACOGR|nr:hypothetical protein QJS04_geneDACA022824 [Acorus gramineus]